MLGLNISAGMRTAVSIYILIPLILVPMLLLGGAMIKFDDLHKSISKKIYVPLVADLMVTRWAYESLCVEQFKSNRFEKPFFRYDMEISQNDWYASFLVSALKTKVENCLNSGKKPEYKETSESDFAKLNFHIKYLSSISGFVPGSWFSKLNYERFNEYVASETITLLDSMKIAFRMKSRSLTYKRDSLIKVISNSMGEDKFNKLRADNYNENLANFVLNRLAKYKIYDSDDKLIQKADPIFMAPGSRFGRAHFLAPFKQLGNLKIETMIFDMLVVWLMILCLFVTLYYNILKRFIRFLESLKLPILRKFGRELLQM
jgi:hypothetical protein